MKEKYNIKFKNAKEKADRKSESVVCVQERAIQGKSVNSPTMSPTRQGALLSSVIESCHPWQRGETDLTIRAWNDVRKLGNAEFVSQKRQQHISILWESINIL